MKWEAKITHPKPLNFVIEHDELAGYYLYVYENGIDTHDHLQDTLEFAMEQAMEDFDANYAKIKENSV